MFFGRQSSSTASGKSAQQQDASHPAAPVVISPASSLAPSVATSVAPTLPAKTGLFSKWQRSSHASSASSLSVHGQPTISELLMKNGILRDHNDGLMQVNELNQMTVRKLATDCEAKEKEYKQLRNDNNSLITHIERYKQETHVKTATLLADNQDLIASRDELVQERDELAKAAITLDAQQAKSQHEHDALASRAASAEGKVKQYVSLTNTLKQQVNSYTAACTRQQQSSKEQVDAIYAQQLRTEQRTKKQLQAKDAIIRELQAKLKQSEAAAAKANISREDEIATLSVKFERIKLDRDQQAQVANDWQNYSNVHLDCVHELEEQVKQLTARSA